MNALFRAILMSLLIVVLTSECLADGTTDEPRGRRRARMRTGEGRSNSRRRVGPVMSVNRTAMCFSNRLPCDFLIDCHIVLQCALLVDCTAMCLSCGLHCNVLVL
ncbi:hypothetical protein ACJMK2_033663 [Sinanodonta woodiana]|uniref:Secreted protein n=1 Tax=Sinanodonta woodiana TaxID=1069815 RepID=A0ABD3WSU0_SINWO